MQDCFPPFQHLVLRKRVFFGRLRLSAPDIYSLENLYRPLKDKKKVQKDYFLTIVAGANPKVGYWLQPHATPAKKAGLRLRNPLNIMYFIAICQFSL